MLLIYLVGISVILGNGSEIARTMKNSSLIFVLALISVFANAYCLQCYECENCETVTENDLKTCGTIEPTTTALPTNPTETTAPPTNPTSATAQPTNPTEATAAPTNPTEATAAPTNPTSATAAPTNPTSATAAPTNPTSATAAPTNPTAATASGDRMAPSALRVKQFASESLANLDFRATDSYSCYKLKAKENGTDQTFRGCVLNIDTNRTLCEEINAIINVTDCSTCTTDKCNGAALLQFSLIPLLFAFTFSLM